MVTIARPMSAEELWRMADDGFRYELVRGELRRTSPAGQVHGKFAARILVSLGVHVEAEGLGEVYAAGTGFTLANDPDHVRAPDCAFVSAARLAEIGESSRFAAGAPDLAIEVMSPSDRCSDVAEKVADWLDAGTRAVVVVDDRRRRVTVHRSATAVVVLTESDTLEVGEVVPGWRLPVSEIFG